MPLLCNNSNHSDSNIRLASLHCLGMICEEVDPESLSNQVKNNIILALTTNITADV